MNNGQFPNNNVGFDPAPIDPTVDPLNPPVNNGLDPLTQPVESIESLDSNNLLDPLNVEMPLKNENIGTIPPEKPKKKGGAKKVLFVLLILILMGGVAYGVYYYLNMGNSSSSVTTKTINHVMGEELSSDINEYATFKGIASNTCALSTKDVDTSVAGEYEYTITCNENTYKGMVNVVDESPIEVTLKNVYKQIDEEVTADEFIDSCSKENCTYEFVSPDEVNELVKEKGGPFEIEIIVTDENGLTSTITGQLVILESDIIAYLEAVSNESSVDSYNASLVMKDYFGIGDSNKYVGFSYRVYEYTFSDASEFATVMEEYSDSDTFEDKTGNIEFDEENQMLLLTVPLTKETLDLEYENDFPDTYSSIKSYYENKGFSVSTVAA